MMHECTHCGTMYDGAHYCGAPWQSVAPNHLPPQGFGPTWAPEDRDATLLLWAEGIESGRVTESEMRKWLPGILKAASHGVHDAEYWLNKGRGEGGLCARWLYDHAHKDKGDA